MKAIPGTPYAITTRIRIKAKVDMLRRR